MRTRSLVGLLVGLLLALGSGSQAMTAQWTSIGPLTDEIFQILLDPQTPSTMYLYMGDLFKSTNSGTTWQAVGNGLDVFVTTLVIDPVTPTILYAGTINNGVYKSTTGGAVWTPVGLSQIPVTSLAIDPVTPTILYAATRDNGAFKSTDGGITWQPINTGFVIGASLVQMAIDPLTPSTLYAITLPNHRLMKTTTGGQVWQAITHPLAIGITSLLFDPIHADDTLCDGRCEHTGDYHQHRWRGDLAGGVRCPFRAGSHV